MAEDETLEATPAQEAAGYRVLREALEAEREALKQAREQRAEFGRQHQEVLAELARLEASVTESTRAVNQIAATIDVLNEALR